MLLGVMRAQVEVRQPPSCKPYLLYFAGARMAEQHTSVRDALQAAHRVPIPSSTDSQAEGRKPVPDAIARFRVLPPVRGPDHSEGPLKIRVCVRKVCPGGGV